MSPSRLAAALGLGALVAAGGPALTTVAPLRRRMTPRLSGVGADDHIALTFDDGPDPASTPVFLDLLARHERRATFFVLGEHAAAHPALVRRMSDEGHEVAIHGWTHRCTAAVPPTRLGRELSAARRTVEDIIGTPVTWYRPPYGVLTTETLLATRGLDLRTVLWTAWGRDWERSATPSRIVATVLRRLRPGGTILLHDTDQHARGDWRNTLEATAALLDGHLEAANVGPLRQHWRIPTQ
jgi:peptidoglycan/xylan/chitin deacetylase (PgdA/CDA1 family)